MLFILYNKVLTRYCFIITKCGGGLFLLLMKTLRVAPPPSLFLHDLFEVDSMSAAAGGKCLHWKPSMQTRRIGLFIDRVIDSMVDSVVDWQVG